MPEHPDYPALVAGCTAVLEAINSGEQGLSILDRLLRSAAQTLDTPGLAFVEYGPSGGRVVAAIGAAGWAIGHPLPPADQVAAPLLTGPPVQALEVEVLPAELAHQLDGAGLRHVLAARVEISGLTIGALYAFYPDATRLDCAEHRAVLGFLAAGAAHLYRDQAGLPVHGDGSVVAALADGLAIVNRDGIVQLWNPAAERVTGLRAAEVLDQPLPIPVPPPGQVLDHRLPDGRWLTITAGDLPGATGARVVTFSDSSDQQLRDHDRDLFVAVTSHELRTPVTVIKGYADTLTTHWDSLSESDRRQAAGVIGQRAGELARLVDRLLASTNDAGRVGGSPPMPFDLVEALRAAADNLPTELRHRLVVRLPEQLPKALGDRASLDTVLTELVTNAGKYSPEGTPVELTAEADRRTVAFRVSDRGIGVRPDHVERAFERFWQADSGDRRRYPGAGLGLYLVRRIVERQNGWVSLRPRDGGGTVAEVRLPRG
ncbi:PAS domain-containing sensor histidine kinase [Micromonospora sp. HM5-17]|uniref:sensor histidine kinase n=1 Tax=Micromonospora sp. HM5-17 TaxID=2487710 RepID=UPI000F4A19EB|nr:PAS domain-containing sensor histidine kinase [Micromonospora sp. HM5-17]ROT33708.1 PAS domain-containing protein [Micromonospora sp. HM5-17]